MSCVAPKRAPASGWTAEEIAAEERARRARRARDMKATAEDRLEETLRLSRFVSELQAGVERDVPPR